MDESHSVSVVSRQYDVNANQLFRWRGYYQEGHLDDGAGTKMLPVAIHDTRGPNDAAAALAPVGCIHRLNPHAKAGCLPLSID
ncbi:hypothetical protein BI364_07530 [Acidihalobacter yilgarnensis]|uniref:Transposase n=2 Tax=Acidihalobacter yilgarnensis TaxID=2819280 RepID=A0A1D8IMY6_9GAMM|nr:hypothetical protein BI364_07530 [Acidihalobacter yilgarnensis]